MADIGKNFYEARTKYNKHGEETPRKVYAETGVTASSIEYYEKNERIPNMKNAQKLAEHYGVNILWLMGKSESRLLDENSQMVTKITGLSSDAVEQLCSMGSDKIACLNALLTSYDFQKALFQLSNAKEVSKRIEEYIPPKPVYLGKVKDTDIIDGELVEYEYDDYDEPPQTADEYADMIEKSNYVETKGKQRLQNIVSDRELVQMYRYRGLQLIGNAFAEYAPSDDDERKVK